VGMNRFFRLVSPQQSSF